MNPRLCSVLRFSISTFLFSLLVLAATPAAAQSLQQDLAALTARPAVTGYEAWLSNEIKTRLAKWKPQQDNMGNVWVTIGSGAPSRLIVAPMDEPGYIVSGITTDGFLRVQRLPQAAPNAVFDLLHAAQPVVIQTRKGQWVYGVVAGLSTHLQGGRRDAPRGSHPDEIYVDIGASSTAEVKQAGVDLLDPLGLDRQMYSMGFGKLTGPGIGDRFGVAALLELLRRVDAEKVKGTLTVAFTVQQWAPSRGLDRLMQHVKADEVIHVVRMRAGLAIARSAGAPREQIYPKSAPGSGIVTGKMRPEDPLGDFPAELKAIADQNSISFAAEFSVPLTVVSYTRGPEFPKRFAHVGIPVAWPNTPAETIDAADLANLAALLELYAQGTVTKSVWERLDIIEKLVRPPDKLPRNENILRALVESYGMSEHEGPVREEVLKLLPAWAKPETDNAGNLVLHFAVAKTLKKTTKILFVAHMDELGYAVRAIAADGRLEVQSRGGGITEFFNGHAVLVHAEKGIRPGVIELPTGWEQPNFEWPRGSAALTAGGAAAAAAAAGEGQAGSRATRVDVGARTPLEVAQLGIKVGDSITIPKKYRKLFGTRANGRSFDDRVGCASLISAVWALGATPKGGQAAPKGLPADVTFVWSTGEEIGLVGAKAVADRLATEGATPDFVFAVDTFVSSDSPLESKRFADAPIGKGFVIRAVDNSNITDRAQVDKLIALAKRNQIPVQYGVTGGGNDGATFLRHGAVDIPISWPLRYSHSPGEVIDTRDLDALARIVAAIARNW